MKTFFHFINYFVYILHSKKLDKHYVVHTREIPQRLVKHLWYHKGFTERANDWIVQDTETHTSKTEAQKGELLIGTSSYLHKIVKIQILPVLHREDRGVRVSQHPQRIFRNDDLFFIIHNLKHFEKYLLKSQITVSITQFFFHNSFFYHPSAKIMDRHQ